LLLGDIQLGHVMSFANDRCPARGVAHRCSMLRSSWSVGIGIGDAGRDACRDANGYASGRTSGRTDTAEATVATS
jgi:hypothetical protein